MKQHPCPRKLLAELCEGDHYQFETYLKNKPLDPVEELETAIDLCFYMSQTSTFNKGYRLEFKSIFNNYYYPILRKELSECHQTEKCNWVKHQGDFPPPVYLEFEGGDDTIEEIACKKKNKIIFLSILWGCIQAGILKEVPFKHVCESVMILFGGRYASGTFRNYNITYLQKLSKNTVREYVSEAYAMLKKRGAF